MTKLVDGRKVNEIEQIEDERLGEGDVLVDVEWSSINFKDAGRLQRPAHAFEPLVCGIDLAGTVISSDDPGVRPSDRVIVTGWGLGQDHFGGYAQRARVKAEWTVPVPQSMTTRQAMTIGTAGFTAMLSVLALEDGGVTPDAGPVLVTGASGGLGSLACLLLSNLGYRVIASTGSPENSRYLRDLGVAEIIDRRTLEEPTTRMLPERWAGAIDAVGSHTLGSVIAQTCYSGTIAVCGLVQGGDLSGTLLPFLLRGVRLQGIESDTAPRELRMRAWQRLSTDLDIQRLDALSFDVPLVDVPKVALDVLAGRVRGRAVVDVANATL